MTKLMERINVVRKGAYQVFEDLGGSFSFDYSQANAPMKRLNVHFDIDAPDTLRSTSGGMLPIEVVRFTLIQKTDARTSNLVAFLEHREALIRLMGAQPFMTVTDMSAVTYLDGLLSFSITAEVL